MEVLGFMGESFAVQNTQPVGHSKEIVGNLSAIGFAAGLKCLSR